VGVIVVSRPVDAIDKTSAYVPSLPTVSTVVPIRSAERRG
jgi:hypothetical protein